MKKVNNKNRYNFGSFVKTNGVNIGGLTGILGQAVGGSEGNVISGIGSGIAAGAALGPIGAGIGGLLGLGGALLGNSKRKKAEEAALKQEQEAFNTNYRNNMIAGLDTNNQNPYGNLVFATGGIVPFEQINIEQGELQIDPVTGKILREYDGINPENGKKYTPHNKGKDSEGNFVTAEPGTFIVTKKLAKDYKDSVDNNDKIHTNTILQNIKNTKDSKDKSNKMALGSFVDPTKPPYKSAGNTPYTFNPAMIMDQMIGLRDNTTIPAATVPGLAKSTVNIPGVRPVAQSTNNPNFGNLLNTAINFAPSLLNIGQGLFGKVEQQQRVNPILNPYANQVLNNMPEEVSINPLLNRINRNQVSQFRQIDNTTSSNPIARANKNNVFANTQNLLGDLFMQQTDANNRIKTQRGNIYNNLGQQAMQEQGRAQQINLGIDESNVANRAAKTNLLNTGLSQLQQVVQNNRLNKTRQSMDKYKVDLLRQMFPNLRYYGEQFGEDALNQLIGG